MELGRSREYKDSEIIEDLQTEIKEIVSVAVRNVGEMLLFRVKISNLLNERLPEIKNEELRETAKKSLEDYALKQLQEMNRIVGLKNIPLIFAFAYYTINKDMQKQVQKQVNDIWNSKDLNTIRQGYSNLGNSQAMKTNTTSLLGHAETTARYERKEQMLDKLRNETKLVICDVHSDCSERCSKWQGKIYSLDGTYGKTADGKSYQPLENATDIYDKYGYKNGLLGFNCRHKLIPYKKGMQAVRVSKEEQQREYAITLKQRQLERDIRREKSLALTYEQGAKKQTASDIYKSMMHEAQMHKLKAQTLIREYNAFCDKYERTKYRSRIEV